MKTLSWFSRHQKFTVWSIIMITLLTLLAGIFKFNGWLVFIILVVATVIHLKQYRTVISTSYGYTRQAIPDEVKEYVWQRDQGHCVNCGSQERLEFDHIIPVSKGGSNTVRNIQLLCEHCNRSKGAGIRTNRYPPNLNSIYDDR